MDISTKLSIHVKIGETELVLTAEDAEMLYKQLHEILGKDKDVPCPPCPPYTPYTPYTPYIPTPTAPSWTDIRPWYSTTEFHPGTMIRTDDPTT